MGCDGVHLSHILRDIKDPYTLKCFFLLFDHVCFVSVSSEILPHIHTVGVEACKGFSVATSSPPPHFSPSGTLLLGPETTAKITLRPPISQFENSHISFSTPQVQLSCE